MKELYQKYKKEIGIGVIVSLITTLILKFGDWMVAIVPSVGASIFETLMNITYSLAATNTDVAIFRMFVFAGLGIFIGIAVPIICDSIKTYKASIVVENRFMNIPPERCVEEKGEAALGPKIISKSIKPLDITELTNNRKRLGRSTFLSIAMLLLICFITIVFLGIPMRLRDNFDQDIVKITPYVEENVITQLKSDWVCMRSKSDYDAICEIISDVEERYSLPARKEKTY